MPKYSDSSCRRILECHLDLQVVFYKVLEEVDHKITCGFRGEAEQMEAYESGTSKLKWGESKHNIVDVNGRPLSEAIDAIPYPVDWNDIRRFDRFASFVQGVGYEKGIHLRWGGDWDRDWDVADNVFNDLPHFELVRS